jgi:hypothetical protein
MLERRFWWGACQAPARARLWRARPRRACRQPYDAPGRAPSRRQYRVCSQSFAALVTARHTWAALQVSLIAGPGVPHRPGQGACCAGPVRVRWLGHGAQHGTPVTRLSCHWGVSLWRAAAAVALAGRCADGGAAVRDGGFGWCAACFGLALCSFPFFSVSSETRRHTAGRASCSRCDADVGGCVCVEVHGAVVHSLRLSSSKPGLWGGPDGHAAVQARRRASQWSATRAMAVPARHAAARCCAAEA